MIAVVIPAKDEAERIGATVRAALAIGQVVVVDDGSRDDTATVAREAGATVVAHGRNRGKGAAMTTGAAAVPDAEILVFLDADLGETAADAHRLVTAVQARADCAIATIPPPKDAGGHGFVVRLARDGIEKRTGFHAHQPLSGQRAIRRAAFDAVLPLADGFGVEVGMTVDLLGKGYRVVEVPVAMSHRVTGTGWRDQLHRARQYRDVRKALRGRPPSAAPE